MRTIVTVAVISVATYFGLQHFQRRGGSSTALRAGR